MPLLGHRKPYGAISFRQHVPALDMCDKGCKGLTGGNGKPSKSLILEGMACSVIDLVCDTGLHQSDAITHRFDIDVSEISIYRIIEAQGRTVVVDIG